MEEMDNNEALNDIPDEELLMNKVIQNDAELYFLHHYLSEVYSKE